MKQPFFKVFALLLSVFTLSTTAVLAQAHQTLKASVPFNFIINKQVYPAGDYTIETVYLAGSQSLKLQSTDGHLTAFLPTRTMKIEASQTEARLVFNKVADRYFLAQVFAGEEKVTNQILASNCQSKLAKRIEASQKATLSVTAHRN
jgi:hypothetical protein